MAGEAFYPVWTVLVSGAVILTGGYLLLRWLATCGAPIPGPIGLDRRDRSGRGVALSAREELRVFALSLLFRLVVFALAALFLLLLSQGGVLSSWRQWDAVHYEKLTELGYGGYVENGQHLFLVFFPLYVWLVRLVRLVVGNTLAAGLLVSWLCYAGGCVFFCRLACLEYGRRTARRAVIFLSLFPYAFFFGGMMTEGLFLLTTAAGLWHIRRHQWWAAGLWGILAALTRMHGLLLVGAALAEFLSHREKGWLRRLPLVFLPVLGTLAYLWLNRLVTGDPFAFVQMQRHWNQGFCWVSDTLWYVLHNAWSTPDSAIRWQIWIPTLLLFPLFFTLLLRARRQRSMLTLYAFACLILDYSLSWLLSAGRYLSCALPFFLFAADWAEERPAVSALLTAAMAVLFSLQLILYLTGGQIM